jgi:YEATS domain-containing protein 4
MTEDMIMEKELVVGHLARRHPKPSEYKTHHWEIFLYSPTGEDLTKWVQRTVFHLHQTFAQPERICTQEPYRVAEDGWGEFEAQIDVIPKCGEKFTLTHMISFPAATSRKPGLIERRTEKIVFRNPPPLLYEGLTAAPLTWNRFKKIKNQPHGNDVDIVEEPSYDESLWHKWNQQVTNVSKEIRAEIQKLSDQLRAKTDRILVLLEEIRKSSPDIAEAASMFL